MFIAEKVISGEKDLVIWGGRIFRCGFQEVW